MDAVSYPNGTVIDFITERMVPLRVPSDAQPLSSQFRITWTPTLVTLDMYGTEHHRTVGFLPPEELVPALSLAIAKIDFAAESFNDAILNLDFLLNRYPRSGAAPEAVYLRGVSRYKSTKDAGMLKEAYARLTAEYPDSEWARRAQPYNLL
ncbi:outer membrane protein assembly factor BamD [Geobacter pickeringii]|uniref:Uncharacterized protein n=1 Tax=Geobacter pickeringii TaxID=345632 RepID=A0A0B5BAP2_9BACT|nr:outer membrane protein assembly factor BamD [Geobacter pickeringii]AJE02024.1 hypothetical protein GPICK_00325 [Geobacter pickeringii]